MIVYISCLSLYAYIVYVRTMREMGGFLRQRRADLGVNQSVVAKRAGVSRQWLVAAEQGKDTIEAGKLLRLLRALEVTPDLLLTQTIPKNPNEIDLDALLNGELDA
jgi:HTH-type transcriptional regulator / antitoxin HipB